MQLYVQPRSVKRLLLPGVLMYALGIKHASADMGAWTSGLEGSAVPLAEAVLISGAILAALSLSLLLIALLEVTGVRQRPACCGAVYPSLHAGLAILWLGNLGIASYLLTKQHYPAVAFVAAGGVFFMLHLAIFLTQVCWWFCGGVPLGVLSDHPKSALLTAANGGDNGRLGGGGGPANHPGGDGPGDGNGPFRATYGLLPGSSVFAYHIFIPEEESRMYTGLQSGPQRPAGPAPSRKKVQPLISLQSTGHGLHQQQQQHLQPETPGQRDIRM